MAKDGGRDIFALSSDEGMGQIFGGLNADRQRGKVKLAEIGVEFDVDETFQMRVEGVDEEHVQRLVNIWADGGQLPNDKAVLVATMPDRSVLVDGFHRVAAAIAAGQTKIPARFVEMTLQEALERAEEANLEHSKTLGMSRESLRRIFESRLERGYMYELPTGQRVPWGQLSTGAIGEILNVPKPTVARWFEQLTVSNETVDRSVTYGKDGRAYDNSEIVAATKRRTEQAKLDGWLAMIPTASNEELATMHDYMRGAERIPDYEFGEHKVWAALLAQTRYREGRATMQAELDRLDTVSLGLLSDGDFQEWVNYVNQADVYGLENHRNIEKVLDEKWRRANPDPSLDALEEMSTDTLREIFNDKRRKDTTRRWAGEIIGKRNEAERKRLEAQHSADSRPAQPTGSHAGVTPSFKRTPFRTLGGAVASDQSPVASKGSDQPPAASRQPVQTPANGEGVLAGQSNADMAYASMLRADLLKAVNASRNALNVAKVDLNNAKKLWKRGLRMLYLVHDVDQLADDATWTAELAEDVRDVVVEFIAFWDEIAAKLAEMAATGQPYEGGDDGDES